jgi:DNA-binding response OmpR family regulator
MPRFLLIEDEPRIVSFIEKGLGSEGYTVMTAEDGEAGLARLATDAYDLVILDIGLPGRDGFSVLSELRRVGHRMPVIILTARNSPEDVVRGLEGGADDYVTKPFRFEVLLARIRARLRVESVAEPMLLSCGDATLDVRRRRLEVEGRSEELTAREFALADLFFRHPGQVLSREQILSHVWGYDYDPASNVVEVYIRYLRHKLGEARITTVRGMGYRLEET